MTSTNEMALAGDFPEISSPDDVDGWCICVAVHMILSIFLPFLFRFNFVTFFMSKSGDGFVSFILF